MNAAITAAKETCDKLGLKFEQQLALYLEHGYVTSTPDRLMLFRPACTDNPSEWLTDDTKANAWFVFLAAGPGSGAVRWFFHQQPWTLPFLIWARGCRSSKKPHIYSTSAFLKHI